MRSGGLVLSVIALGMVWLSPGCSRESPKGGAPGGDGAATRSTTGGGAAQSADAAEGNMKLEIDSAAFGQGQTIPERHTGEGKDRSPPLSWYNVPAGTKELALIMDDPDAPSKEPWVHWVIYKMPTTAKGLAEGLPTTETLAAPAGAMQGKNSWPTLGYRGPMPPVGHGVHHYHFKLYALDAALEVKPGFDKPSLLSAMKGHVLAQAELVGTYERTK